MSFIRIFSWAVIGLFIAVGAGLYWKSQGENKGQAAEKINASKETVMTNNLIGHWTFDGDNIVWDDSTTEIKDSTVNANHGNALGALARSNAVPGMTGQGLHFNGSSDYVSVPDSALWDFNPRTGQRTVTAWVKFNSLAGDQDIFGVSGSGNAYSFGYFSSLDSLYFYDGNTIWGPGTISSIGASTNTWYFLSWVVSAGTTTFYKNGASLGTDGLAANANRTPTAITIGNNSDSVNYFNGSLDDVRIYNTALTATQVADLYRATSAKEISNANHREVLTDDGLVGYWTFDGRDTKWSDTSTEIKDISGNANHGDASGLTQASVTPGKLGQGLSFNGTSDYVGISENSGLPVYTNNTSLSIAFWVKASPTGAGVDPNALFVESPALGMSFPHFQLKDLGDSGLYVKLRNNSGVVDIDDLSSTSDVFDNNWHHVAWTDDNGSAKLYIDGVQDATNFNYTRSSMSSITQTGIGYQPEWGTSFFLGLLDDIRIYNRALSATEVFNLYSLGK